MSNHKVPRTAAVGAIVLALWLSAPALAFDSIEASLRPDVWKVTPSDPGVAPYTLREIQLASLPTATEILEQLDNRETRALLSRGELLALAVARVDREHILIRNWLLVGQRTDGFFEAGVISGGDEGTRWARLEVTSDLSHALETVDTLRTLIAGGPAPTPANLAVPECPCEDQCNWEFEQSETLCNAYADNCFLTAGVNALICETLCSALGGGNGICLSGCVLLLTVELSKCAADLRVCLRFARHDHTKCLSDCDQ